MDTASVYFIIDFSVKNSSSGAAEHYLFRDVNSLGLVFDEGDVEQPYNLSRHVSYEHEEGFVGTFVYYVRLVDPIKKKSSQFYKIKIVIKRGPKP